MNKPIIKTSFWILAVLFGVALFPNNALAQDYGAATRTPVIPRKPSPYNPNPRNPMTEQVLDLRQQYEAILNRRRDGTFLLYKGSDGTSVFLPVRGDQPGPLYLRDSKGQPMPGRPMREGESGCYVCWESHGNPCARRIRIKCPIETR